MNAFHVSGASKHSGLHFVGEPCGQEATLKFVIPNATRPVSSGYRVRLVFLHSYEHFGNFTIRLEAADARGTGVIQTQVKELSGLWTTRTSVPSPEVIAHLPASARGKPLRLTITAPRSGSRDSSGIAITGLRVLDEART